jgi:mannose-6-phosphate isomerase-like protein (cupin superfamily)
VFGVHPDEDNGGVILANADGWDAEKWFVGPWNSALPAAISFGGHAGPTAHAHDEMFEIYLVANGAATIEVDGGSATLSPGQILVVEPGEVHRFTDSTPDYRHFVVQTPFVAGDKRLA